MERNIYRRILTSFKIQILILLSFILCGCASFKFESHINEYPNGRFYYYWCDREQFIDCPSCESASLYQKSAIYGYRNMTYSYLHYYRCILHRIIVIEKDKDGKMVEVERRVVK